MQGLLHGRPRRILAAQVAAGECGEQMGLDQGEVGVDGGTAVEDGPELAAGSGGVLLGERLVVPAARRREDP